MTLHSRNAGRLPGAGFSSLAVRKPSVEAGQQPFRNFSDRLPGVTKLQSRVGGVKAYSLAPFLVDEGSEDAFSHVQKSFAGTQNVEC